MLWLVTCVWLWPGTAGAEADTAAKLREQKAQLSRLRKEIQALGKNLENRRARKSGLERDLHEAEQRISAIAGDLHKLDARIEQQNKRLADTRRSISETRDSLAGQREALAAQLRAAYRMGRQQRIKLLLSQQNPAEIGRMLTYYEYYNRARTRIIQEMHGHLQKLATLRDSQQQQSEKLNSLKAEHQQTLAKLESAQAARSRAIAELEGKISSGSDRLASLRADEKELETLLQRLQKALEQAPAAGTGGPFATLKGELPWPLQGPLLARFGASKSGTHLRWEGVWIGADTGSDVRAVAAGRVVYVGWMHRYGLMVIIAHQGGYYSLYAHDQAAYVSVGDAVSAGQRIATAGDTGGHSDSGVYFEIRKGKTPLDPLSWLVSASG